MRARPRSFASLSFIVFPVAAFAFATACSDDPAITPPGNDAGVDAAVDGNDGSVVPDGTLPKNPPPKVTECSRPALTPPSSGLCTVKAGTKGVILRGSILAPNEVLHRGEVLVDDKGIIACTSCDCSASANYADATVVECADGVISPGLINPHDHITYANNAPVGHGTERYEHRNEWRKGINGHKALPYKSGASTAVVQFAELRFLMGGTTSTAGAGGKKGLIRNIDSDDIALDEGLAVQPANSDTFPLADSSLTTLISSGCAYPTGRTTAASIASLDGYLPHLAEGIGAPAHNELVCTNNSAGNFDLLAPPTAIIHSIAMVPDDAAQMRTDQTRVVWSPRSNVDLYGNTAPITMLDAMGVQIALGTDWVPSGSMNMNRELRCADELNTKYFNGHFTDADLWRMVTINAAYAVGAGNVVGQLTAGYVADIAIFDGKTSKDHRAVVDAGVEDVSLVLRGGKPLYGDDELMTGLGAGACETFSGNVCGIAKRACVAQDIGGGTTLASIRTAGDAIYPLFFCKNTVPTSEPSCVPYRDTYPNGIAAGDKDGDGVTDEQDNCPAFFNPVRPMDSAKQSDVDGDGLGDACDRCPTDATNKCTTPNALDVDGDGVLNEVDNCARTANADQADGDKDGHGDLCDACPTTANPGATGCLLTVPAIRDKKNSAHPKPGAIVTVNDLWVTAVQNNTGVFAEDGTQKDYTGLFVNVGGGAVNLKRGNKISVTGVYEEIFGISTIYGADVKIVDPGTVLPFQPLPEDPANLKTGGSKADAYVGMLVSIGPVTILNDIPDGASSKFYEFTVTSDLRIDDSLFVRYGTPTNGPYPPPAYTNGKVFTKIVGIESFSFSNSKLWPRDAADIQP